MFKDPSKLEASIVYTSTTMPMHARCLVGAVPAEVALWLSLPLEVAKALVDEALRRAAGGLPLGLAELPAMIRRAAQAAGAVGARVVAEEVMLRFDSAEACEECLALGREMLDHMLPARDLGHPLPCTPRLGGGGGGSLRFLSNERLKLCWDQVAQIRSLLPNTYCRPHKAQPHPHDSHPIQYALALFHFTLKMAFQYREPTPYSRRLATYALERLATSILRWMDGGPIESIPAAMAAVAGAAGAPPALPPAASSAALAAQAAAAAAVARPYVGEVYTLIRRG